MSFLRCCVGADPRPPPEAIRPVGASSNPNRRNGGAGGGSFRRDSFGGNKKFKMPNEVFFDPSKPDGQLSSVTDQGNSGKDLSDPKKKKESKDKSAYDNGKNVAEERSELDLPDNNGLTRGQNFMKVEKWLRSANQHTLIDISPGVISNIEDFPADLPEHADPPSEKDRLPLAIAHQQSTSRGR